MFTGLVEDLGEVDGLEQTDEGVRITVRTKLASELGHGDSIAVNGCCLTAVERSEDRFSAVVIEESLRRTSLGGVEPGRRVNLELALRADARLGGHIMQGHVDGLGSVRSVEPDGTSTAITIDAPPEILKYVVEKGSIAIDGISLTVSAVDDGSLAVSLIPETLERTTLGRTAPGTPVNLEVDIMAKYAEKMLAGIAGR